MIWLRQSAGRVYRVESECFTAGIHCIGRCWHRDLIWKIRFFLRHIQLPGKSGADGDAAPYAAGRSRPQSGRLRNGLSGSAGSAAHLAGAVYHAFFAGRGNAPLRQPGVCGDQAVSGQQLPRRYLAGWTLSFSGASMLLFTAYPCTPIKSSFEDAGSVEDMMRCSKLWKLFSALTNHNPPVAIIVAVNRKNSSSSLL